jgi:hypothetical protein
VGRVAPVVHNRRAFVLGKRPDYFSDEKYAWPRGALSTLTQELSDEEDFEFIGGAGSHNTASLEPGIRNFGFMNKDIWLKEVAESSALVCHDERQI